ncbi:MAG: hypothetical protein Q9173_000998 [Seirophora scorigena]
MEATAPDPKQRILDRHSVLCADELLAEMMLPQFRVRKWGAPVDGDPVSHPGSGNQNFNALIRITSTEYDEIIAKCTPSALSYIDEEDGETIRVGSSLELAQRLDDPVPPFSRSEDRAGPAGEHTQKTMPGWYAVPDLPPCHSFDINNCQDVDDIWRSLAERTRLSLLSLISLLPPQSMTAKSGVPNSPMRYQVLHKGDLLAMGSQDKHQAQAPGDELRGKIFPAYHEGRLPMEVDSSSYQPRWASHNNSSSRLGPLSAVDPLGTSSPLSQSRATSGRGSRPTLLEVFDGELAKLSLVNPSLETERSLAVKPKPWESPHMTSELPTGNRVNHLETIFRSVITRIEVLDLKLQSFDMEANESVLPLIQTLQHGIHAALEGFCTCVEHVVDHFQLFPSGDGPNKGQIATLCHPANLRNDTSSVWQKGRNSLQRGSGHFNSANVSTEFPDTTESVGGRNVSLPAAAHFPALERCEGESPSNQSSNTGSPGRGLDRALESEAHGAKHPLFDERSSMDPRPLSRQTSASPQQAIQVEPAVADILDFGIANAGHPGDDGRPPQTSMVFTPYLDASTSIRSQISRGNGETVSGIFDDAFATDHADAGTAALIQECVDQLRDMGFGSAAEGGVSRLVVYAQTAQGDLGETIDLIAEEKRVYEEM